MKASIANAEVEDVLRGCLEAERYKLSPRRTHGQTGVDIIAEREGEKIHIECIGYQAAGSTRAKDFYESFFRAVSRLNDGATRIVIALAKQAEVGLPSRAKQHAVAWKRIGEAFPELELWLVDVAGREFSRHKWSAFLQGV